MNYGVDGTFMDQFKGPYHTTITKHIITPSIPLYPHQSLHHPFLYIVPPYILKQHHSEKYDVFIIYGTMLPFITI